MENIFFNSWSSVFRIVLIGVVAYGSLILLLRASGKRTLSKMNAFDFIVTVVLGSILATVLLSKDVALTDGLVAFALLIFLQFAITWLSVRFKAFSGLIKAEPTLLMYRGHFLRQAMRSERVTEEEVLAVLQRWLGHWCWLGGKHTPCFGFLPALLSRQHRSICHAVDGLLPGR